MPILKRRTRSATTAQPAGTGAVPSQRDTQEGTRTAETASGAPGTGSPAARAEYTQTEERRAEVRPRGEAAEAGREARRRHYGMASTLLILSGMLTFFVGIIGVIRGIFFNNVANYPFYFSVRSRGVLLLVIGAIAFLTGFALLARVRRAREVAIVVALASAVANFIFLPFYPFWSIIVLILDVIIIWELTREGDRRESDRF
jgi:hypothetical protein